MKKKMLSSLLVLVLFLSIAPVTAFGAPQVTMTLAQQTTGEFSDLDKEFVYYIPLLNYDISFGYVVNMYTQEVFIDTEIYSNVEVVEDKIARCRAGDVNIFARGSSRDERDVLYSHQFKTGHNIIDFTCPFYKITLKGGQSVEMNAEIGKPLILLADLEDNYSLSCIAGDEETPFPKEHPGENGIVNLTFEPKDGGTITLKQTNGKESEDTTTNNNPYTDVNTEDWFYPAVKYMSEHKYMVGYSETEFSPNDTLSRAMFVTVLYRVSGEKVQASETKFTDVPKDTWYTEAVAWAVANGVTSGTSDNTFSPDDPVTREQMATFIERYAKSKGIDLGAKYVTGEPADLNDGNDWGRNGLVYAYEYGLLFTTGGKAYPTNSATRTDAVVAFHNFLCRDSLVTLDAETCNHNWETRHIEEVGHWETNGTHQVKYTKCWCGAMFYESDPDFEAKWKEHRGDPLSPDSHWGSSSQGYLEMPNREFVIDSPAREEVYCTICGVIK